MTTEERLEKLEREVGNLRQTLAAVGRVLQVTDKRAPPDSDIIVLPPDNPDSLTYTSVAEGQFATEIVRKWNHLVHVAISVAVEKGYGIADLRRWTNVRVKEGSWTTEGYTPIRGTNVSVSGMCANDAWKNAFALAQKLKCEIKVNFHWQHNDAAAHPGKRGLLHWSPETGAE